MLVVCLCGVVSCGLVVQCEGVVYDGTRSGDVVL